MRKNKVGSIFLVSMLAMAGLGISYAGFTDVITVYGSVDTATVEIDWIGWYSGTWVWKIWGDQYTGEEIYTYTGWAVDKPTNAEVLDMFDELGVTNVELESWSYAAVGTSHGDPLVAYDVDLVFDNLFPCIDFSADFIFHYGGSIPAKINTATIFSLDQWLIDLWTLHESGSPYGAWVEAYFAQGYNSAGQETDDITQIVTWTLGGPVDVGTQLHYCDYVYVKLVIHLPQDNTLQGRSGTLGGTIGVIQWYEPQP